ncbi:MAG: hypothetical protein ACXWP6_17210 [Ktedonobacterales bacterium]
MAGHPESDDDVRTDSSASPETDRMREVDLDVVVRRQTPTRTRVIQVGVLLMLLLVVGGLVFRGYWAGQTQATTAGGDDYSMNAAIFSNVNHGALTVNGKKLAGHPPVIVTLRPGTNTISISVPPFGPHTCTFDVTLPNARHQQCSVGGNIFPPMDIGGKKAATRVDLPVTLTDLPAEQQHSIAAVVAQEIDGIVVHTTVPAHQYIATGVDTQGHITSRLTDEELQADAILVRRADQAMQSDDTCVENICAVFNSPYGPCGLSDSSSTADTRWMVATFVTPQWRFTTPTGDTAALSPLSDASNTTLIEVPLHYDAAHGWRPWGSPGIGNFCSALDIMAMTQCNPAVTVLSAYAAPSEGVGLSLLPHGIEGCEVQLVKSGGTSTVRFIWRFGVLLAANAAAHKLIPSLPVAPQAEIDAVTKQA